MKGKRIVAGLLTAAMLITSPAVTKASLMDDDLVELNEIEQTEEPETEEPAINPAEESDEGGGYETDWDKLKDEIDNAISAFSLDDEEEPVEEEVSTKAKSYCELGENFGGSDLRSIFSDIGKYKLNWTGNENYYWGGNGGASSNISWYIKDIANSYSKDSHVNTASTTQKAAAARALGLSKENSNKNAAKKIYNSSSKDIKKDKGVTGVKKAFLIWQTRSGHEGSYYYKKNAYGNAYNKVALIRPDGTAKAITADGSYTDWRPGSKPSDPGGGGHLNADGNAMEADSAKIHQESCYYADVTNFIKKDKKDKGYGTYTVCNIRPWEPDGHGAGCTCQWQLLFVENYNDEANEDSVAVINIRLGSYSMDFPEPEMIAKGDNVAFYDNVTLPNNLSFPKKTKVQVLLGSQANNEQNQTIDITIGKSFEDLGHGTTIIKDNTVTIDGSHTTAGLWKNNKIAEYSGASFSMNSVETGDVTGKKACIEFRQNARHWCTYYLCGTSVNLPFPFTGTQKTEAVNDTDRIKVTVSNSGITNKVTAGKKKMGIYNGKVTVYLDSKLTANTATGSGGIGGSIDNTNHTVTFSGVNLKKYGDKFTYTIDCTASTPGTYYNSDEYGGKLWDGNEAKADRETGKSMGTVYSDESQGAVPPVETVEIRYHLNATNEASMEAVDGLTSDSVAQVVTDTTPKNDPNTTKYPYAIKTYEAVGFYANDGFMPGMSNVSMSMFWTTTADGSGTRYYPGSIGSTIYPTGDVDLYAHWMPDHYNVIYDANGGTGDKLDSDGDVLPRYNGQPNTGVDKAYLGDAYAILGSENFTRPGYTFTGWNTKADCTGYHYEPGTVLRSASSYDTSTVTLYAQWEVQPKYEVQYVNGYNMFEGKTIPELDTASFYNGWSDGKSVVFGSGDTATNVKCLKREEHGWIQDWNLPSISQVEDPAVISDMESKGYVFAGWGTTKSIKARNTEAENKLRHFNYRYYLHEDNCVDTSNLISMLEGALEELNTAYNEYAGKKYEGSISLNTLKRKYPAFDMCRDLEDCIDVYNYLYEAYTYGYNFMDGGKSVCCLPIGNYGCSYYTKPDGTKVVTLCAVWVKRVDCEVMFEPNKDARDAGEDPSNSTPERFSGTMPIQTIQYKRSAKLEKNQFARSRHRFVEWKKSEVGVLGSSQAKDKYADQAAYDAKDGITLLGAQWVADTTASEDEVIFVSYRYSGTNINSILGEDDRHEKTVKLKFPSESGSGTSGGSGESGSESGWIYPGHEASGSGSSSGDNVYYGLYQKNITYGQY